ncbi:hypothetical protein LTR85_004339 [Meristemomyces frigidus]|nr:hypothetical protein LTR85_004339 [Meristemomyces frigidus]
MLVKANRFCEGRDFYARLAPVLKTLHRDGESGRVRDVRPGEMTIYDFIDSGRATSFFGDAPRPDSIVDTVKDGDPFFYNDRDAGEDLVLFPEESGGKGGAAIVDTGDPIMSKLMAHGPSMKRFILDLDSDEDSDDFEDPDVLRLEGQATKQRKSVTKAEHERALLPPCPYGDLDDVDTDCNCPECEWIGQQRVCDTIPELADYKEDCSVYSDDFEEESGGDVVLANRLKEFCFDDPFDGRERDPGQDWMAHVNREKSKVFKQQMHAAEIEQGAKARWTELKAMIDDAKRVISKNRLNRVRFYGLLMDMNWHVSEHRLVTRDMQEAFATVSMFFPDFGVDSNTELRAWKHSLARKPSLFDNVMKANKLPYARKINSNRTMPDAFWVEPDRVCLEMCSSCPDIHRKPPPREWDKVVRPMIAKLFKAGIIGPGYVPYPEGHSLVASDPEARPEEHLLAAPGAMQASWYVDYRDWREDWPTMPASIRDPTTVDLLASARRFAAKSPAARFTLLRLWTHSHFYPITLGLEKRDWVSFSDCIGRSWTWTFIPNDMPNSEWSMQHNTDLRLARIKRQYGRRFEVKRDMVLVMAGVRRRCRSC